jgi:hypothetical protein
MGTARHPLGSRSDKALGFLKPRGSWVYLVASLPLVVFALMGPPIDREE